MSSDVSDVAFEEVSWEIQRLCRGSRRQRSSGSNASSSNTQHVDDSTKQRLNVGIRQFQGFPSPHRLW